MYAKPRTYIRSYMILCIHIFDIRMYVHIRTYTIHTYALEVFMHLQIYASLIIVIDQVTGVILTCEPVDLINQCNATWLVSYH